MFDLLQNEIEKELKELESMEMGTPKYDKTITGLNQLMQRAVDLKRLEDERIDNKQQLKRQIELDNLKNELDKLERERRLYLEEKQLDMQQRQLELQEKQHKQNRINNWLQIGATVAVSLIGFGITIWGTRTTLEYEDKGIIQTTLAGKEHTRKLF